jgi:acetyl-CoA C-acetyltransferase
MNNPVYLLSGSRTALGSYLGSLSTVPAPQLAGTAIKAALQKSEIDKSEIHHAWIGQVLQAGVGQAPARQAVIAAGLLEQTSAVTVNKVCGSGLEAIISAARSVALGEISRAVAGGMENMSLAPHLLPQARSGVGFGNVTFRDAMQWDGLWDVYSQQTMGHCAEQCLIEKPLTREQQDQYAMESFKRAQNAQKNGYFDKEIAPVKIISKKSELIISTDESPAKADFAKIPNLKPVFNPQGSITAANASSINDGAAAVVLSNDHLGKKGVFKILSYASHASHPTWFTTAPVMAIKKALELAKMKVEQIDHWEINEAFATVPLYAMQDLKIDHAKLNPYGGAIALGHPIGCSGARIVVTLMHGLERTGGKYGLASLCIGGGEGLAMIIERIS